jgi:TolB protein
LDATGTPLAAPYTYSFTTGASAMPASQIAFASSGNDPGAPLQLFLMNPAAPGAAALLLNDTYRDEQPTWSPDGRSLVFLSYRGGSVPHLYLTPVDAPDPHPLLTTTGASDVEPSWSPDGLRVAFSSSREQTGSGRFSLWVVGVDPVTGVAGTLKRVTTGTGYWDANPEWGPDKVIFGGSTKNLLAFSSAERVPGKRLLYAVDVQDTGGDVGELAGRPVSLLTPSLVDINAGEPAWSPDGTKIAFSSGEAGSKDIWLVDVGVSGPVGSRTVTAVNRRRLTTDPANEEQPVWSPDGKYLLFVSDRNGPGNPDLFRLDVNDPSATPTLMAGGGGKQTNPAWSRQ